MDETWLQQYICFALRVHKATQTLYNRPFVEAYYGPALWREQAEAESEIAPAELVRQAIALTDTLSTQDFTINRKLYLNKQIQAMETLCRKMSGESFSLAEEARHCLDIGLTWTSEARFEQAHALYDTVLPGTGTLAERLRKYRNSLAFPLDQRNALQHFINLAFAEARQRTQALLELPSGELIEVEYPAGIAYDASARYQGNYCTRIEMNLTATAAHLPRLFDHKVCHEGYPGHHTEYVLKEQYLAREYDYTEQTIVLTLCPQCVITEGIAMVAHEMIFAEGEAEQWITEQVYQFLHKNIDATALLHLRQASEMLQDVWDNAAMLLDEGRPALEVAEYCGQYMLLAPEQTEKMVAHLQDPIWGRYELAYASGQKLLQRWLQGADRVATFRRFLTEQFTPSQLASDVLPGNQA